MNYHDFLFDLNENQAEVIEFLNDQFLLFPDISRKMRYKVPFYFHSSWVCYLNPKSKTSQVELCFLHGRMLSNSHGILEHKNRKMVAGITLEDVRQLPTDIILETFSEALMLDKKYSRK